MLTNIPKAGGGQGEVQLQSVTLYCITTFGFFFSSQIFDRLKIIQTEKGQALAELIKLNEHKARHIN